MPRIISKFRKKDNICNICQQEKELSIDHVPPQCCPPAKSRLISKLHYELIGDKSFKPRPTQNGVTYQTICSKCNSWMGQKYDKALGEFCQQVELFLNSSIKLPDSFEVKFRANAVMRSILGHILAAKTETDEVIIDKLIRSSVLDSGVPIPDDVYIYCWIYPFERSIILRDFALSSMRQGFQNHYFLNLVKFYPLAFVVVHEPPYCNNGFNCDAFLDLHQFNQSLPDEDVTARIQLRPLVKADFPEIPKDIYEYLAFGKAAEDSVFSLPKPKLKFNKQKLKKII